MRHGSDISHLSPVLDKCCTMNEMIGDMHALGLISCYDTRCVGGGCLATQWYVFLTRLLSWWLRPLGGSTGCNSLPENLSSRSDGYVEISVQTIDARLSPEESFPNARQPRLEDVDNLTDYTVKRQISATRW